MKGSTYKYCVYCNHLSVGPALIESKQSPIAGQAPQLSTMLNMLIKTPRSWTTRARKIHTLIPADADLILFEPKSAVKRLPTWPDTNLLKRSECYTHSDSPSKFSSTGKHADCVTCRPESKQISQAFRKELQLTQTENFHHSKNQPKPCKFVWNRIIAAHRCHIVCSIMCGWNAVEAMSRSYKWSLLSLQAEVPVAVMLTLPFRTKIPVALTLFHISTVMSPNFVCYIQVSLCMESNQKNPTQPWGVQVLQSCPLIK